jgi:hypothetical protein
MISSRLIKILDSSLNGKFGKMLFKYHRPRRRPPGWACIACHRLLPAVLMPRRLIKGIGSSARREVHGLGGGAQLGFGDALIDPFAGDYAGGAT